MVYGREANEAWGRRCAGQTNGPRTLPGPHVVEPLGLVQMKIYLLFLSLSLFMPTS